VISPQFDGIWLGSFKEGLASVQIGGDKAVRCGFVDPQGRYVINPQFDEAFAFSEGMAAIRIGDDKTGKWGYISK